MADILVNLRKIVEKFMTSGQNESAYYWAEFLINTSSLPSDNLLYAETLFKDLQYRRVLDFIKKNNFDKKYFPFRLLAAKCYFALKEYIDALQVLDRTGVTQNVSKTNIYAASANLDCSYDSNIINRQDAVMFGKSEKELENEYYLLLGEIYESLGNRESALYFYKLSVKADVKCFKAVKKMAESNLMTISEANSFVAELDFTDDCHNGKLTEFLRCSYLDLFSTECETGSAVSMSSCNRDKSHEKFVSHKLRIAFQYFNNTKFKKCYDIVKGILTDDPNNPDCRILYTSTLKELQLKNELYNYANSLVQNYPDKREAWYATGCYHLVIGRPVLATKNFMKATEIDKHFGYAWLALGHTHSIENHRDEALNAYCAASQAMRGNHIPILYMALEYSLSNNIPVAMKYMQEALTIGPNDPYCLHEKGFIEYNNKNYKNALEHFLKAYENHKDDNPTTATFWEPLLNNIGHCYYKLGDYDKALLFFQKALNKKPRCPSTLLSIALVYVHMDDLSEASGYIMTVLGLDRDNKNAINLLTAISKYGCKSLPKSLNDEQVNWNEFYKTSSSLKPPKIKDVHDFYSSDFSDSLKKFPNLEHLKTEETQMDLT